MNQKMTVSFAKAKASETAISHNNRSLDPDHFDFDNAGKLTTYKNLTGPS